MPRRAARVLGFAVALALAACAGEAGDAPRSRPLPTMTPPRTGTPNDGGSPAASGQVPAEMVEAVVADAAERAGVAPEDVEVVEAQAVTWNDGSLGCPEPGMAYTQALVPGYRVVVEAGGERMHFHAGSTGDFRFCANPAPGGDSGTR